MPEPELYLPAGAEPPFPVVVWIHGGGWSEGSHVLAAGAPQLAVLDRGYALASVPYRLSGAAVFPAQIEDVKMAIRWLRSVAPLHQLDRQRIAAWGESAGGHLAALLGTSGAGSCAVNAVIDWYGPTDFLAMDAQTATLGCRPFPRGGHDGPTSPESLLMGFPIQTDPEAVRSADPAAHVSETVPPFLIQHGTRDCLVPWHQSRHLAERIADVAGAERVTLELLDAGHGGAEFTSSANLSRVCDFLDNVTA